MNDNNDVYNIIKVLIEKFYARPYIEKGFINDGKKVINWNLEKILLIIFQKKLINITKIIQIIVSTINVKIKII